MLDLQQIIQYIIRGFAVAVAAYMIMRDRMSQNDVLTLGLTAAAVFAVLDQFTPVIGLGAGIGTGVGLGMKLIG